MLEVECCLSQQVPKQGERWRQVWCLVFYIRTYESSQVYGDDKGEIFDVVYVVVERAADVVSTQGVFTVTKQRHRTKEYSVIKKQ